MASEYTSTLQLFDCLTEFQLNKPKFTENFLKLQPQYLQAYAIKLAQKLKESDYLQQDILLDPIELINLFHDHLLINKSEQMKQLSNIVRMTIQLFDENQFELLADFYINVFERNDEEKENCSAATAAANIIEKYLDSYLVIYDMIMIPYGPQVFEAIIENCLFNDNERIQQITLIFVHSILNDVQHHPTYNNIKSILIGLIIKKFTGYHKKQCLQSSIIVLDFIIDTYLKYNENRRNIIGTAIPEFEIECIWKCLLDHILSDEMFIRKTVISILKKIVTHCFANQMPKSNATNFDFPYTFANKECSHNDWNNFFIIADSLISNHSHLIMPTLLHLNLTNGLPRNWFYQLMCLILKNDNDQIFNVGLQYILDKLSLETDDDAADILNGSIFENYIYTVLLALNSTQFYSTDKYKFKQLKYFIENYYNIILKCLIKYDIKWKSKPYFLIIMALSECEKIQISYSNVSILIANAKKIQDITVRELTIMDFIQSILEKKCKPWDIISYFQLDFDLSRVFGGGRGGDGGDGDGKENFMINQMGKPTENEWKQIIMSNDVLVSNKILYLQYLNKDLDVLAKIFDCMIKSKSIIFHIFYQICKDSLMVKEFLYNRTNEQVMTFCTNIKSNTTTDIDYIKMNISLFKLYLNLKGIINNKLDDDLLVNIYDHYRRNNSNNTDNKNIIYYKYFFVNVLQAVFEIAPPQELNVFIIDSLKMITLDGATESNINSNVYTNESIRIMEGETKKILLHLHIKLATISLCDDDEYFNFESILLASCQLIDEHQHPPEDLILILKCIKTRKIKINEKFIKFIDHVFKSMIENLFVNCFTEILTLFIEIVYCTPDEERKIIIDYPIDYITKIMEFSNKKPLLLYTIMELIENNSILYKIWKEKLPDIIVTGLLFEKKLNGELKYNAELIKAYKCGLVCEHNDDVLVRKMAFRLLASIDAAEHYHCTIEKMLLSKFEQLSKSKPRYYLDSFHHRLKLRILQALMHLYDIQKKETECAAEIDEKNSWDSTVLLNGILIENNLPNILLLLESIIAFKMNPQHIFDILKKATTPQSIRSIILIMYQMCQKQCASEIYVNKCIDLILPWTMSDNFETRFIAQSVMLKLIQHNKNTTINIDSVLYKGIDEATRIAARKSSSNKIDLEFNLLPYTTHIYFQNALYVRLKPETSSSSSLSSSSMIESINNNNKTDQIFSGLSLRFDLSIDMIKTLYGIHNTDLVCNRKKVLFGNDDDDDIDCNVESADGNGASERFNNVQAKILPTENYLKKLNKLIVVASLVTRMSNLGGLARSCEVFGVHKLVINSLKYLNDKEFKALSMTAEKWLNFAEIKSDKLIEYIIEKRNAGYLIIGAEQTIKSRKIQDLKFPEKTILLLGDEKNGIPPHLLALLDQAIEIPQFGIIPSLNVHVTGALFMWEYAKQFNI